PSHPSGWEKEKLGWLNYTEISSGTHEITSYSFETSPASVYKLKAPDTETEYFVVYHTSKTAYSPSTPGNGGLLIWHIDEGIIDGTTFLERKANNSLNNYSHRTADVEEADYTDPSVTWGDSGDLWPGTRQNFTPSYSNKYDGQPSRVNVQKILNYVQLSSFTVSYKPFIGGYARDAAGKGIAETVLHLSANSISSETITDSNGYYSFTDLSDGAYTVTPSKTGYNFLPTNKAVIISGYYSNNNNFTGLVAATYSDLTNKPNNIKPVNNLFVPGSEKTTVYYKTAKGGKVTIKLYTLDGRFIKTLLDENVAAGAGLVEWDGQNSNNSVVASGIYLVQITAPDYREIKKICVIR
ncbi:MAG TPA: hypothetical protein DCX95_01440, partial [Elusimicrobia bacterium]|nr:hypothetical protein [Elusimicrobiota bacterium]